MEEIRNYSDKQFSNFAGKFISQINVIENIILKGHIISEYAINCYLESISNSDRINLFKSNYTYSNKIFLLEEFGRLPKSNREHIIYSFKLLNKIRNEFAHSLSYNEFTLRDLIASIKKIDPKSLNGIEADFKNPNERKNLGNIAYLLSYLNGYVFGLFQANMSRKQQVE